MRVERSETVYFSNEEYQCFRKSMSMVERLLEEVADPDLRNNLEDFLASFDACDNYFELM